MHSNVTSKNVSGFTLAGPPCTSSNISKCQSYCVTALQTVINPTVFYHCLQANSTNNWSSIMSHCPTHNRSNTARKAELLAVKSKNCLWQFSVNIKLWLTVLKFGSANKFSGIRVYISPDNIVRCQQHKMC